LNLTQSIGRNQKEFGLRPFAYSSQTDLLMNRRRRGYGVSASR
jgi:hypothetical protein